MRPEPLPCQCGRKVRIDQECGGQGTRELTQYQVQCKCGVHVTSLGTDGTTRSAIYAWNKIRRTAQSEDASR